MSNVVERMGAILPVLLASCFFAGSCGGETGGGGGAGGTTGSGGMGSTGGGGSIEAACSVDADCAAASLTSDPCYSPGCEIPVAASSDDLARIACLKAWDGTRAPPVSTDCTPSSNDVACPAACAVPPVCVLPYCDAGACKLEMRQEAGATCVRPASGGDDCAALDATRDQALEAARACIPNGTVVECAGGQTVDTECGCPVLVNDSQSGLVATAEQERAAWAAACDPPERCSAIDCAVAQGSGVCGDDGAGVGHCVWE